MGKPAILIVDGDEALQRSLKGLLLHHGFEVLDAPDTAAALGSFPHEPSRLLVVGPAREDAPPSPLPFEELMPRINRHSTSRPLQRASEKSHPPPASLRNGQRMIGKSSSIQTIKTYIARVACTDSNALITGETGTGKELVAELIHQNSSRHHKPFLCINCAAIPDSLLESELFGYERGAFTGAHAVKEGQLQLAHGGTIFLDEIGDMSPYAQAKILRVIESRQIQRLGGKRSISLDLRVIAATNQDLEGLMADGKFRKDLYFRLNVARIHLPPLRDRREDIHLLCEAYLQEWNRRLGLEVEGFTQEALAFLLHYDWPGNVRELRNLLEATFINLTSRRIAFMDLPEPFRQRLSQTAGLSQSERERVLSALFATQWNMSKAAQQLHWSRMTLYRKLRKYRIVKGGKLEDGRTTSSMAMSQPCNRPM